MCPNDSYDLSQENIFTSKKNITRNRAWVFYEPVSLTVIGLLSTPPTLLLGEDVNLTEKPQNAVEVEVGTEVLLTHT
jgi:hypothetical protein